MNARTDTRSAADLERRGVKLELDLAVEAPEAVVDPIEIGTSTLTFTWGTATLDVTVDVTAPPM